MGKPARKCRVSRGIDSRVPSGTVPTPATSGRDIWSRNAIVRAESVTMLRKSRLRLVLVGVPSLRDSRRGWIGLPGTSVPGFPMPCLRHLGVNTRRVTYLTDAHSRNVNIGWMAHKYPNILVHCVFSTKERKNVIPDEIPRLCKYFAGIGRKYHIPVLAAGGTSNHIAFVDCASRRCHPRQSNSGSESQLFALAA